MTTLVESEHRSHLIYDMTKARDGMFAGNLGSSSLNPVFDINDFRTASQAFESIRPG